MKATSNDTIGAAFLAGMLTHGRAYYDKQAAWHASLRKLGIAATHPDDGWVNRANNTIHLCYPHIMADVLKPGSIIALGDSESYRLVRLTKFTRWITAIKPTDGTWSFEPHS